NTAVAQVIDVVDLPAAIAELHEILDGLEDVALGQGAGVEALLNRELVVELDSADVREVVAILAEEQGLEQVTGRLQRRRISRPQAPIDLENRFLGVAQLVLEQRVAEE